ncbi:hypothetical protein [Saliphagus sp. LR7]|uniref:hypothetical protein n=1 Tax=Saliphagus sp. LR7 TaxID=2282654 RepID=UPI000DF81E9C|nr:hypothetical protein [Saliphagus sp. LR7]
MKRRTFVAAVGSGLGPTVAGCLGNGPGAGRDPADDDGNGSDGNRTGDPGDRTDGTRTRESEDSPEGNDSDGTEGDDPDGDADGSGYAVALEDDPVETVGEFATLRVELVDPHVEPGSPAALKATLTNETEGTLAVSSGAPWPFGVLWAESEDGGESITLWNDAYEESEYVGTDGKRVEDVEDIGVGEEIGAGESITRAFEIHEDTPGLEPGSYGTSITVGIGPRDDSEDRESLESELVLAIGDGDPGSDGTDDPEEAGNGGNAGYTVALENGPVEDGGEFAALEIELVDPHVEPESPAALEATLTNTAEEAILVTSGAPAPFGVLRAESDNGDAITLWSDAYEETDHVQTDGKDLETFTNVALVSEFEPEESITRTFEIHAETSNLEAGTYESSVVLDIGFGDKGDGNKSRDPDGTENLDTELVLAIERTRDDGTEGG